MPLLDLVSFINKQLATETLSAQLVLDQSSSSVLGEFSTLRLTSVFQPLFNAHTGAINGYEALLRATEGGNSLSPMTVFSTQRPATEIVLLDRFCRYLHTLNFLAQQGQQDLYLNINAGHLRHIEQGHGLVFERTLHQFGLEPTQIVLEIVESALPDSIRLRAALENYRARGYRIALDDFGSQYSNFDRLWLLTPDIVKLDRSLLAQAQVNPRAQVILPRLVEMLHDLGAKVVAEGIETAQQKTLAQAANVDLLQGFFLACPSANLTSNPLALS